jgi:hypothetical protein
MIDLLEWAKFHIGEWTINTNFVMGLDEVSFFRRREIRNLKSEA